MSNLPKIHFCKRKCNIQTIAKQIEHGMRFHRFNFKYLGWVFSLTFFFGCVCVSVVSR